MKSREFYLGWLKGFYFARNQSVKLDSLSRLELHYLFIQANELVNLEEKCESIF